MTENNHESFEINQDDIGANQDEGVSHKEKNNTFGKVENPRRGSGKRKADGPPVDHPADLSSMLRLVSEHEANPSDFPK